jgi:thiamine-monophosphate kinase
MNPFTRQAARSVASLGEAGLIDALRGWLGRSSPPPPRGIGDDCAVLRPSRKTQLLTVDSVVYGRHFDDRDRPAEAGAKLLKRNLSDLAAMGAKPAAAVVALTLAPGVKLDWLEGFYRGMAAAARRHRVPIVGGDIAQSDGFAAILTLLGEAAGPRILTRKGARIGDWIYVTGRLGASLESGHHLRFQPRLAEGAWFARRSEVRSMIDLSDGLAKDLPALAPPGAEGALFSTAIPRRRGASLEAALCDGEDYELLVSLAAGADREAFAKSWRRSFPRTGLACIGRFVSLGRSLPGTFRLGQFRGYEHLRR